MYTEPVEPAQYTEPSQVFRVKSQDYCAGFTVELIIDVTATVLGTAENAVGLFGANIGADVTLEDLKFPVGAAEEDSAIFGADDAGAFSL